MPNAILGTGMAGTAHWSMAIEEHSGERSVSDPAPAIIWDVAARLRREVPTDPHRLGSDYRLNPQQIESGALSLSMNNDGSLQLNYAEYQCSLFVVPTGDPQPTIQLIDDENESNPPIVRIGVKNVKMDPPQTIRWKYGLRWSGSAPPAE